VRGRNKCQIAGRENEIVWKKTNLYALDRRGFKTAKGIGHRLVPHHNRTKKKKVETHGSIGQKPASWVGARVEGAIRHKSKKKIGKIRAVKTEKRRAKRGRRQPRRRKAPAEPTPDLPVRKIEVRYGSNRVKGKETKGKKGTTQRGRIWANQGTTRSTILKI